MSAIDHQHIFNLRLVWTGNRGAGTRDYRAYARDHVVEIAGKPDLHGSSHPTFRGDTTRHNPEDLLVAALSACHMLAYLHLCATHQIVVSAYADAAQGLLQLTPEGGGRFTEVHLNPSVTVDSGDLALAETLHHQAHQLCFIANSVNFPVRVSPVCHRPPT